MKKILSMILLTILISSCGSPMTVNGKTYECYGYFDKEEVQQEDMNYRFVKANLFPIIIGFETLIIPVLLIGYETHCPSGLKVKDENNTDSNTSK